MISTTRNARRWRKPSLCECGGRMTLMRVHDHYCLVCYRCGHTGSSNVPSLMAEKESA